MVEKLRWEIPIGEVRAGIIARTVARVGGGNAVSNVRHVPNSSGFEAFLARSLRNDSQDGVTRRAELRSMSELVARSYALNEVIEVKRRKYGGLIAEMKSQVNEISSKGFYASPEDKIWSEISKSLLDKVKPIESNMDDEEKTIKWYQKMATFERTISNADEIKVHLRKFNWSKDTFKEYIHDMDPLIHHLNFLNIARKRGDTLSEFTKFI